MPRCAEFRLKFPTQLGQQKDLLRQLYAATYHQIDAPVVQPKVWPSLRMIRHDCLRGVCPSSTAGVACVRMQTCMLTPTLRAPSISQAPQEQSAAQYWYDACWSTEAALEGAAAAVATQDAAQRASAARAAHAALLQVYYVD